MVVEDLPRLSWHSGLGPWPPGGVALPPHGPLDFFSWVALLRPLWGRQSTIWDYLGWGARSPGPFGTIWEKESGLGVGVCWSLLVGCLLGVCLVGVSWFLGLCLVFAWCLLGCMLGWLVFLGVGLLLGCCLLVGLCWWVCCLVPWLLVAWWVGEFLGGATGTLEGERPQCPIGKGGFSTRGEVPELFLNHA